MVYSRGNHPNSVTSRFQTGSKGVWSGKERKDMLGDKHPNWKGGKPTCHCGVQIAYKSKNCKDHSFSESRKERIRAGALKRKGEKSGAWKDESVSYRGLHAWIVKNYGQPDVCEDCEKRSSGHSMHWANVSGKYKRDRSDWKRLCPACHGKFDSNKRKYVKHQ